MPTPAAVARTRRTFWLDPRFVIGILLVAASVGGVVVVVTAADHTTTVYAASSALAVGDRVTASDLTGTPVRLGAVDKYYLTADRLPAEGAIVTRPVAAGELVPVSAVGAVSGAATARVVLSIRGTLPGSVGAGSIVDVWSASELERGTYGPPAVLAGAATVIRIVASEGIVATRDTVSVEVQVPRRAIAAVLAAQANGDVLSAIPVGSPLGR